MSFHARDEAKAMVTGVMKGPLKAAGFHKRAMKWLARFSIMEDIYDEMIRQQRHFDAAMAARVLGRGNVPELLDLALEHAPHDNFADFVRRWMAENGFGGA